MTDMAGGTHRTISPIEAQELVESGAVTILDVRSPGEYRGLGHIPGAILLPVDLVASGVATLPRDGKPLLVYCEHGIRSAHAARFLAAAGFRGVLNMSGGMSCWRGERDFAEGTPCGPFGPSSWLLENADILPAGGTALDLACGRGRHTLLLASAGYAVTGVDNDQGKLSALRDDAAALNLPLTTSQLDLETGQADLGAGLYDLILVVHYLHRPLFPAIHRALKPGGLLLYETFTVDQAAHGHPRNPDFLLKHGELESLVAPLAILRSRDGEFEGRFVAGVAARQPKKDR